VEGRHIRSIAKRRDSTIWKAFSLNGHFYGAISLDWNKGVACKNAIILIISGRLKVVKACLIIPNIASGSRVKNDAIPKSVGRRRRVLRNTEGRSSN
jgi:hypothetical protein